MAEPKKVIPFEYNPALEQFAASPKEFLEKNTQYTHLVTGAAVFNEEGKLLLIQRAAHDAFPLCWEIPGGMVDKTDETLLHAVARELKEETGLEIARVNRKIGENHLWTRKSETGMQQTWLKITFEVEVKDWNIVLDPNEHVQHLFATEEEVLNEKTADVQLKYGTPDSKAVKLEAFRRRSEAAKSWGRD